MHSVLRLFFVVLFTGLLLGQAPNTTGWETVDQQLGRTGAMQPGDVYKVGLPRTDLHVTVGNMAVRPALALGGWLAFKRMGQETMVMGDLVMTEDEVGPVTAVLQAEGVEQTAIHNHLLHETPRILYMHVYGHGDAAKLAKSLHDALGKTKLPPAAPAAASTLEGLDQKQIEQALGRKGKVNGGVLQFGVPRAETITDHGMEIPPSMGVATGINFQPSGAGKAAITGDFVLVASEVNPVIQVLNQNGIEVTALHSHMLTESPRLFFMHFWANADAMKLARALNEALGKTNSVK